MTKAIKECGYTEEILTHLKNRKVGDPVTDAEAELLYPIFGKHVDMIAKKDIRGDKLFADGRYDHIRNDVLAHLFMYVIPRFEPSKYSGPVENYFSVVIRRYLIQYVARCNKAAYIFPISIQEIVEFNDVEEDHINFRDLTQQEDVCELNDDCLNLLKCARRWFENYDRRIYGGHAINAAKHLSKINKAIEVAEGSIMREKHYRFERIRTAVKVYLRLRYGYKFPSKISRNELGAIVFEVVKLKKLLGWDRV